MGSKGMGVTRVEEALKASTELTVNGSEDDQSGVAST
ncbi:unnamed protein product [Brassica rapa]|uniref:Uncharacterized protein n=1 Tax=Brassica campestris TaxID=3711 RepID=A0A3P6A070_BRACM|nr:unnamed protein product [Brassica rapa]VDC80934.1 unnamed protein product [Brassica rapa]